MPLKRILVTGAAGFCGAHLCRILRNGKCLILGTSRRRIEDPYSDGLRYVKVDMRDRTAVTRMIRVWRPDEVYHLAGQTVPRYSWKREEETMDANVGGAIHLLNAIREHSPGTKVLYVSSNQVYGKSFREAGALSEEALLYPENPYASSKALAEFVCLHFVDRFGLKVVVARPTNHMGKRQTLHFVFSDWCRQIAMAEKGLKPPVLEVGNLDAERDFLHVDDVISAYRLLMRRGAAGEIYNICTGKTIVLKKYVDHLLRKSLIKLKIVVRKNRLRRSDPFRMKGDGSKIKSMGWGPKKTAFLALEDLLNDWRERIAKERPLSTARRMA